MTINPHRFVQFLPRLRLRFEITKGSLEVGTEILLVVAPHDGPVDAQTDFQEDEDIRGYIKSNGRWLVTHWQTSTAEQSHAEDDYSDYHQDHRQNPNNVVWEGRNLI